MKFVGEDGTVIEREVFKTPGPETSPWSMYNLDDSIGDFPPGPRSTYGLQPRLPGLPLDQRTPF